MFFLVRSKKYEVVGGSFFPAALIVANFMIFGCHICLIGFLDRPLMSVGTIQMCLVRIYGSFIPQNTYMHVVL